MARATMAFVLAAAALATQVALAAAERRALYTMTLNTFTAPGNLGSTSYWVTQTGYECSKPSYTTTTSSWTANDDYALVIIRGANSNVGRTLFYDVKLGDSLPSQYGALRDVIACVEPLPPCLAEITWYLGDGWCDSHEGDLYNTLGCDWDGGDCCEGTCVDTTRNTCGVTGYHCKDPDAADYLDCRGNSSGLLGDGKCEYANDNLDTSLNTAMCDWDHGDCCPSTCIGVDGGDCNHVLYDCLDPAAVDFGATSPCEVGTRSWLGDGYCDEATAGYNMDQCAWDGGDCCESTCQDEAGGYVSQFRFLCLSLSRGSRSLSLSLFSLPLTVSLFLSLPLSLALSLSRSL
jgi:hypothetical protein